MNWIILIIAGLCEVGFTYCLGRAKDVSGIEYLAWMAGFLLFTVLSMGLLAKATQSIPLGTAYPVWTGIGAVGNRPNRYNFLQRTRYIRAYFLYIHTHTFNRGTESCISSLMIFKL